jgi:protein-tyrosine phosphatase
MVGIDMSHLRSIDGAGVRVLFVCMGNICRSPMAEAVLAHRAREAGMDVVVDSAGTGNWHVGDAADRRAMEVLTGRGYSLRHHARQVQRHWLADREMVLAMDRENLTHLLSMATPEQARRIHLFRSFDPDLAHVDPLGEDGHLLEVPDPYYGGDEGFLEVLDMLERAADGLLNRLRG